MNLRPFAGLLAALLPLAVFAQQTLVVDDAHSQAGVKPGAKPPIYALQAGPELVVDATTYTFKSPGAQAAGTANSLQLIMGNDRQYSVAWDPTHPIATISAQTAKPNARSKPFAGFQSGQKVVVAIGTMAGSDFNVQWVGMAAVK